ncbi:hypothetical protein H696_05040 [Fonticula alba]|uniref:HPt domain-containing protein n=1 Tax=Fonticula alba TaxID=691883 RepID=A0A058Z3N8_FONAL|nr:hypothetical protein H696_05040 [Fonticula alba]KCV68756.1 hypothetical protein H696_05040 [Fonticula alba]|eukprot:XP_009497188.1 hypothetical protein H696_05040 [Fonticula alba]
MASSPPQLLQAEGLHAALSSEFIDLQVFSDLLGCDDSVERDFTREVVDGFIRQSNLNILNMRGFYSQLASRTGPATPQDLARLYELAHFFRSSSSCVGAYHVSATCQSLQSLASLQSPVDVQQLAGTFAEQLTLLAGQVRQASEHLAAVYGLPPSVLDAVPSADAAESAYM